MSLAAAAGQGLAWNTLYVDATRFRFDAAD
jgi:hypothetical protein